MTSFWCAVNPNNFYFIFSYSHHYIRYYPSLGYTVHILGRKSIFVICYDHFPDPSEFTLKNLVFSQILRQTVIRKTLISQFMNHIPVWILKTYSIFVLGCIRCSTAFKMFLSSEGYFRIHPPVSYGRERSAVFLLCMCNREEENV
jgi:hypothetical protein